MARATTSVDPALPRDRAPTYYGRPALKPSLYGWNVATYIYVGGLAAGVQILVTAAELLGVPASEAVVLLGRAIALAGAVLGGILLIVDLHTRQRFYNMLRIFRATSPMSIGTYVLLSFGLWSLLAFALQLLGLGTPATIAGVLAAVSGWGMTTYTAALLSATSTPLWAATPRLIAVQFASSAIATGAAAACLLALVAAPGHGLVRAFGDIAALALLVQLIAAIGSWVAWERLQIDGPLHRGPWPQLALGGVGVLGIALPLLLYILANFAATATGALAFLASLAVLGGGLLMRGVVLLAGNESARRPEDYFRFARD